MQIKTKIVSCHKANKQEVNGTVILPPLVFPGDGISFLVEGEGTASRGGITGPVGCRLGSKCFVCMLLYFCAAKQSIINLSRTLVWNKQGTLNEGEGLV